MTTSILKSHLSLSPAKASDTLASVLGVIAQWARRDRQRHQLAALSPEMLKDIGVGVSAARNEARKPFWKA